MTVQKHKTILNISDVFSKIQVNRHGQIIESHVTLDSGQVVPLSKNLKRLFALGDLTCSECGCCGTHLQQHFQSHPIGKADVEVWRIMTWSKAGNRISFLNLDHIIPQSHGGTWDNENLRITCEYCNVTRGNHPIVAVQPGFTIGMILDFFNSKVKMKRKTGRLQTLKGMLQKHIKQMKLQCKRVAVDIMFSILKKVLPCIGIQPSDELFAQMISA